MFSWESTPCPTLLVLMAGPVDNREWAAGRQVRTAVAAPYPSCCFHKAHFSAHEGEMSCKRPIFKMTLRKIIKAWSYQWITTVLYFAKHYFLFKRTSAPRNTDSSVLWYFRGTMVSPTPWGTETLIPPRASCGPHPLFQLLWDDKSADIWVDPRSFVGSWLGHQAVGNRFFPLPSSIKSSSVRSIRHEISEQVFARMQIQILTSDDLISSTDVCWECFMVALHQYEDQVLSTREGV